MVTNNPPEPKLKHIYPKSVAEIRSTQYSKIILKFSMTTCGPCKVMDKWLDKECKPNVVVPVYHLISDGEDAGNRDAAETLGSMYNVRMVPRVIFTDASLTCLDSITGWDKKKMEELIKKHFE